MKNLKIEKNQPMWIFGSIVYLAIAVLVYNYSGDSDLPEISKPEKVLTTAEKIKSQFSVWDGSHLKTERMIKESLNDPDSYSHVKTTYSYKGDHLEITVLFRAKNKYNALVINVMKVKTDLDGEFIGLIE